MRRTTTVAAAFVIAAAAAIGTADAQSTTDVTVEDNDFVEADITVAVGDTVQWTQTGSNPHTVTASDGSFDSHPDCPPDFSSCMGAGDTFSQTFDAEGSFTYYCKVHGSEDGGGMAGTITVVAADMGGEEPTAEPSEAPTEESTAAPTQESDSGGDDAPAVTGALDVADQSGDGTTVRVASATISGAPGFVVIHADGGGSPGPVIGHGAIPEGTTTDFTVALDEPLSSSATVFPMLHLDAGTQGTYEFPGADGPVRDADGVITFPITYTVQAADVAADELAATGPARDVLTALALALALVGFGAAALPRRRHRTD